jgi:hypothetical protein
LQIFFGISEPQASLPFTFGSSLGKVRVFDHKYCSNLRDYLITKKALNTGSVYNMDTMDKGQIHVLGEMEWMALISSCYSEQDTI